MEAESRGPRIIHLSSGARAEAGVAAAPGGSRRPAAPPAEARAESGTRRAVLKPKYVATCPLPLPEFRALKFTLPLEAFCGYKPTASELSMLCSLPSAHPETGPPVDLLDPVRAYPWLESPEARRAALAPEDAQLLVGIIPGVEKIARASRHGRSGDSTPTSIAVHPLGQ